MSLLLRRIHLYLALFLSPWILMYTVSTFVMNHRESFRGPGPAPPPKFELERETTYQGIMPDGATPQQIALQLMASLDMEGAYAIARSASPDKIVINRQHPVSPRRITYSVTDRKVTIEKMVFSGTSFLERMHRRRGFQHNFFLEDLWAASVDLTILGLFLLALSGLWMWWELKVTRGPGALALGAGVALFGLFLAVL
jgi:hypothetical protein